MNESITSAAVTIELDRPRKIQFNAFAFIRYAEVTGRELLNDLRELDAQMRRNRAEPGSALIPFGVIRDVLWSGLLEEDEKLSRDAVAKMFSARDLKPVTERLMLGIAAYMPEPEPGQRERPTLAASTPKSEPLSISDGGSGSPLTAESTRESLAVSS